MSSLTAENNLDITLMYFDPSVTVGTDLVRLKVICCSNDFQNFHSGAIDRPDDALNLTSKSAFNSLKSPDDPLFVNCGQMGTSMSRRRFRQSRPENSIQDTTLSPNGSGMAE
jgi:hypothetical protein